MSNVINNLINECLIGYLTDAKYKKILLLLFLMDLSIVGVSEGVVDL